MTKAKAVQRAAKPRVVARKRLAVGHHRKARKVAPRAMVAFMPEPGVIASQTHALRPAAVLRSEDCDKDQPARLMSLLAGPPAAEDKPPTLIELAQGPSTPVGPDGVSPYVEPGTPGDDGGVFVPGGDGGVYPGGVTELPPVGPPLAVPEPSTWAMLLAGFFGVGSALRAARRRRPGSMKT